MFLTQYKKSIRLDSDGFSLFKKDDHDDLFFENYPQTPLPILIERIPSFFAENDHDEVLMLLNHLPPLLIPKPLYDETALISYLQLQFDVSQIGEIFTDEIDEYYSLYFIDKESFAIVEKFNLPYAVTHLSTFLYRHVHENKMVDSGD